MSRIYTDMSSGTEVVLPERFSEEESIAHYTGICYKLNEEEVVNSGGITCIGKNCICRDKTQCSCLQKLMLSVRTLPNTCSVGSPSNPA
jgi:hypothetical protein